jgi:hypothetical protein
VPAVDDDLTAHLTLDVLGQAPDELRVTVTPKAPSGWKVAATPPSPLVLRSRPPTPRSAWSPHRTTDR